MNDEQQQQPVDVDNELIVEHSGFEQVPALLYRDTSISDGAVRMYCILSDRGATGSNSVPTRKKLAGLIGKSVRSVDARLDELEESGWLLITPRFREDKPGMTSNLYRLLKTPIRSEDDARLVHHRRSVASFEEEMEQRIAMNRQRKLGQVDANEPDPSQETAPPLPPVETPRPLAGNCEGPSQKTAGDPSQNPAHQRPDLSFGPDLWGSPTPPADAAGNEADPDGSALFEAPDSPAAPPQPGVTFEDFYQAYPNKKAPGEAEKAWRQVTKAGAVPADVMAGLDRYLEYLTRNPEKRAFMKHPASWLRAKCWLDEYDDVPAPPARRGDVEDRQAMYRSWDEAAARLDGTYPQRQAAAGGAW